MENLPFSFHHSFLCTKQATKFIILNIKIVIFKILKFSFKASQPQDVLYCISSEGVRDVLSQ